MWFLFGFVTLGFACVSSYLWRRMASWSGDSGVMNGIPFEFKVSTSKGRVIGAKICLSCPAGFTFSLRREGEFDRWSKEVGLTRECQTGDAAFDREIYVLSDDSAVHRMLQTDEILRAGIERVFGDCDTGLGKPRSIYVHGGRVWLDAKPRAKKRDVAAEDCRFVVAALKEVAARLKSGGTASLDDRDPFPLRASAILAVSTGLSINAGIEFVRLWMNSFPRLADWTAPLPLALALGFGIVAILAMTALRMMGHSSRTHLVLLELLLSGSFGACGSAYAELRDYNMERDFEPARHFITEISAKHISHGRHSTYYHIILTGWVRGGPIDVDVSHWEYDGLAIGQAIGLEEHHGALGWVWADGLEAE